jgi:hypothetical protein
LLQLIAAALLLGILRQRWLKQGCQPVSGRHSIMVPLLIHRRLLTFFGGGLSGAAGLAGGGGRRGAGGLRWRGDLRAGPGRANSCSLVTGSQYSLQRYAGSWSARCTAAASAAAAGGPAAIATRTGCSGGGGGGGGGGGSGGGLGGLRVAWPSSAAWHDPTGAGARWDMLQTLFPAPGPAVVPTWEGAWASEAAASASAAGARQEVVAVEAVEAARPAEEASPWEAGVASAAGVAGAAGGGACLRAVQPVAAAACPWSAAALDGSPGQAAPQSARSLTRGGRRRAGRRPGARPAVLQPPRAVGGNEHTARAVGQAWRPVTVVRTQSGRLGQSPRVIRVV